MKYYIETYGCQMNVYDSRQMEWLLQNAGHEPASEASEADLLLLNTCAIRESAEQRIWGQLGRYKQWKNQREGRILALCGCMAQNHGEGIFERVPYVDLVLGSGALASLPGFVGDLRRGCTRRIDLDFHEDSFLYFGLPRRNGASGSNGSGGFQYPVFVSIMRGCNYRCTYCIVPKVRGRELYRPPDQVIAEVRALVEQGYREVTLIGQTVNSYECEGLTLAGLLRETAKIDGLDRIRFTTSHPRNFGSGLIDAIAEEPKVCEHVHLPVQSGSDRVLKRMARRYTAREYRDICDELRRKVPGVAITTDLIVGFPGETEEDFRATMDLMREAEWEGSFIFKYSPRGGTAATRLPGAVPEPVVGERFQRLLELQLQMANDSSKRMRGGRYEILLEETPVSNGNGILKGSYRGRTRCGRMVVVTPGPGESGLRFQVGDLVPVRIGEARAYTLYAQFENATATAEEKL